MMCLPCVLPSFKFNHETKDPEEGFNQESKTFSLSELHTHIHALSRSKCGVSVFAGKH
jgi:hypothetical protein